MAARPGRHHNRRRVPLPGPRPPIPTLAFHRAATSRRLSDRLHSSTPARVRAASTAASVENPSARRAIAAKQAAAPPKRATVGASSSGGGKASSGGGKASNGGGKASNGGGQAKQRRWQSRRRKAAMRRSNGGRLVSALAMLLLCVHPPFAPKIRTSRPFPPTGPLRTHS